MNIFLFNLPALGPKRQRRQQHPTLQTTLVWASPSNFISPLPIVFDTPCNHSPLKHHQVSNLVHSYRFRLSSRRGPFTSSLSPSVSMIANASNIAPNRLDCPAIRRRRLDTSVPLTESPHSGLADLPASRSGQTNMRPVCRRHHQIPTSKISINTASSSPLRSTFFSLSLIIHSHLHLHSPFKTSSKFTFCFSNKPTTPIKMDAKTATQTVELGYFSGGSCTVM